MNFKNGNIVLGFFNYKLKNVNNKEGYNSRLLELAFKDINKINNNSRKIYKLYDRLYNIEDCIEETKTQMILNTDLYNKLDLYLEYLNLHILNLSICSLKIESYKAMENLNNSIIKQNNIHQHS